MNTLKIGSTLQDGKYCIERILGQGGFGITYLVHHTILEKDFAIKEFFYKDFCERDSDKSHVTLGTSSNRELVERFMAKFLKEARTISSLEHPNIIRIHDIFKENNTAYYVMEYIEGESLAEKVKSQGALPEQEAIGYIKQVASALDFIHQRSINHLDVKPANIMVRNSDNVAILIDFGLSKQYDAEGSQTSTTPVGISHGYAPIEQYKQGGVSTFSPETDIYALGATLYKLVTGNTPPQPMDILAEGTLSLPNHISTPVGNAINKAMQVRKDDRVKSIAEFLSLTNYCEETSNWSNKTPIINSNNCTSEETTILVEAEDPNTTGKEQKANASPISEENCFRYVASIKKLTESEKLSSRIFKKVENVIHVFIIFILFPTLFGLLLRFILLIFL